MTGDLLVGLDIGTSVVKAGLFDSNGRELAIAAQRTSLKSPHPGWSEAGMEETWQAAAATLRALLTEQAVPSERVAAVGVSGNMIGAWLIDADGKPVRDAILWNDGRAKGLLERLKQQRPDFMTAIFNVAGTVLEHGSTLLVIRWLAENEPDSLNRAQVILHSKDWIRYRLTGEILTDVSEVPGSPGDARARSYSDELFALFGIEAYRHLFPRYVPSHEVVGVVQPSAAEATGLAPGTPVVAGAGDVPAVVLGVGATEPGMACSILGTHSINGVILDHPTFTPENVGILFTIPENRWMRALANVAGTTNLDWFINEFLPSEQAAFAQRADLFRHLEAMAAESQPGARGVLYLPYLSAVGIIAPFFEPAARAQFFGLTREHRRADILRAVYEGVALAIRDCYSAVGDPIHEIRLSGGGARSSLWGQMIADCTGVRVIVPAGSEFGAKGAALLAGVGIGWFPSIMEAAVRTLQVDRIYEPDRGLKSLYDENYATYAMLRDALRPVWQQAARRSFLNE